MPDAYDFPVELDPISTEPGGFIVPNRLAVIHTDTMRPIAVVSKKYTILPHAVVVHAMLKEVQLELGEGELLEKIRPMQFQPGVLWAELEFKKRRLRNQHAPTLPRAPLSCTSISIPPIHAPPRNPALAPRAPSTTLRPIRVPFSVNNGL
jgi:hypothetical protein